MAATGLDPTFAEQLDALIKSAPGGVSISSGFRTNAQQTGLNQLAQQQHPGEADRWAAAPGTSWHEFGLAADLRFASPSVLAWAHANAGRYGLFFPMSWEPWHVQPLWTQGRKPGGADMGGGTRPPVDALGQQQGTDPLGAALGTVDGLISGRNTEHPSDGMSIADRWANVIGQHAAGIGGAAAAGANAGAFSGGYQSAYNLIVQQGGTPDEARLLAAVAGPESGYNPQNHNGNAATGDNSYGLWQINMLGQMGVDRSKTWGLNSYDDLFNPAVNAKAALYILRTQGPDAWTGYRDGGYKQYLPGATG